MTLLRVVPHAQAIMEVRLGRINQLANLIKDNPLLLTDLIQTSAQQKETLLQFAVRFEKKNIALWLLEKGAIASPENSPNMLYYAVSQGNSFFADWCVKNGWDPHSPYAGLKEEVAIVHSPFSLSCMSGDIKTLEKWVAQGVDLCRVNGYGENALHHLIRGISLTIGPVIEERKDVVRWMLEHNVNWYQKNNANQMPVDLCEYGAVKEQLNMIYASFEKAKIKEEIAQGSNEKTASRQRKKL